MDRISQFLENPHFVNWVFQPTQGLDIKWQQFQHDHPDEKSNLLLARKVLQKFRTVDRILTEEEKIRLFAKILNEIEEKQQPHGLGRRLLHLTKYAAVALIFFSVGAFLFYQREYDLPELAMHGFNHPSDETLTTLSRPNGENIQVGDRKSVFSYQAADNKLTINDSIKLDKTSAPDQDVMSILNVPFGKTAEVVLADGSTVYLNAGSQLMYPEHFTGKKREVYLTGEAFFEVHKDRERPFIVLTSDIHIEVKGTSFNLSAYESDKYFETVLAEGNVRIRQNRSGIFEQPVDLLPNQMASFNRYNKETKVQSVDVENYTLWKDGMLKFESSELSGVLRKIERFYNIRFDTDDPALLSAKISGKLDLNETKEAVIKNLSATTSVKIIKKTENRYELRK
ncbi:FecR family protein [Gaoshiqia sp. Z1-71]|uniref:FecR family protein n=1 Tax=Gaoshiqia hydrogeniformans TaxID=3290090 RepID=UPI003BF78A9C